MDGFDIFGAIELPCEDTIRAPRCDRTVFYVLQRTGGRR